MMAWPCRVVSANGTSVALHERPGRGPALVGVHGNSGDHRSLLPLFEHPALAPHAATLVDLPGHGASPRASPERYTLDQLARCLDAVSATAHPGPVIVIGHSLGGHILLQALARGLLQEAIGVVVFGTPPLSGVEIFGEAFGGEHAMRCVFAGELTRADAEAWAAEGFSPRQPPAWFVESVLATDPAARLGLGASVAAQLHDETRVLDASPIPIALLHPERDPIIRRDHVMRMTGRALWGGRPVGIPFVGHHGHWQVPERFAGLIRSFAEELAAGHPP